MNTYKYFSSLVLGAFLLLSGASVVLAHGETAQEGFLRMETATYYDVEFSTTKVGQNERITITGKVKLSENWPTTLEEPSEGYLNIQASGPNLVLKERWVNGVPAPASIFIEKGGIYEFKLVGEGRAVGSWHVHPTMYAKGSGGLIGPGEWVEVTPVAGGYKNPLTLANGTVIPNLDNYGFAWVFWFNVAGFILGVIWMLWWTTQHRTVHNLAVTLQIPLNDHGEDVGLITKRDHRFCDIMAAATVVLLIAGWLIMEANWPTRIPQQVVRLDVPVYQAPETFATATALGSTFDPASNTLVLETEVTNNGTEPANIVSFNAANLTFQSDPSAVGGNLTYGVGQLTAEPATIAPGKTEKVTLTVTDEIWSRQRLIPIGESRLQITGLLFVESGGKQNGLTLQSAVVPTIYTAGHNMQDMQ
jgi:methane/ammonia monooxygenase subunit B